MSDEVESFRWVKWAMFSAAGLAAAGWAWWQRTAMLKIQQRADELEREEASDSDSDA